MYARCGLCQQYVNALSSASSPATSLSSFLPSPPPIPPLYILLISSGSPSLIPIYRERLNCPFPLYVDKGRKIYKALGMNRCTLDGGPEAEKGGYTGSKIGNWGRSTRVSSWFPVVQLDDLDWYVSGCDVAVELIGYATLSWFTASIRGWIHIWFVSLVLFLHFFTINDERLD